ncbi:hypothetical protein A3Q56_04455 [Intoshia linei]|uniref:Solute carrier family 10 member 6 n=1 Tax=Intoshia linei TaxID=1819745 RepID=A0A177B0M3_9BILA|nr:hypothetical protein A3Q56_04455 [Intoshia linei]
MIKIKLCIYFFLYYVSTEAIQTKKESTTTISIKEQTFQIKNHSTTYNNSVNPEKDQKKSIFNKNEIYMLGYSNSLNGAVEDKNSTESKLLKGFQIFMIIFIFFVNLLFGFKFDLNLFKKYAKKPIGPIVCVVCQFTIMPMLAFGTIYLFDLNGIVAFSIFMVGCCPGGGASNMHTALLDGDVTLSIMMTSISTIVALGAMPAWFYTLGRYVVIYEDTSITDIIPFLHLIGVLVIIVIPLILGFSIRWKFEKKITKLLVYFKVIIGVSVLIATSLGLVVNYDVFFYISKEMWYQSMLVPWGGFIISAFISKIFCFAYPQMITIAIETSIQNVGIVFIVITALFTGKEMKTGFAITTCQAVVTVIPLILFEIIYNANKVIRRKLERKKHGITLIQGKISRGNSLID